MRQCTSCDLRKPQNAFDPRETKLNKFATRKCRECTEREEMRQCSKCGDKKVERDFAPSEWQKLKKDDMCAGTCKVCTIGTTAKERLSAGCWRCARCKAMKHQQEFSRWRADHRVRSSSRKHVAWCNGCKEEAVEEEFLQRRSDAALVTKHRH